MKRIIFVCKYNRFRSRVAEAYFKKINRNKKIKVKSRGIIKGGYPVDRIQSSVAKKLGIKIEGRPKTLDTDLLRWQDMIVIVADDVPKSLFKFWMKDGRKLVVWNIPDEQTGNGKETARIVKMIKKKVESLVKELEGMK
jgi:protein-tyrosine-phosphatase